MGALEDGKLFVDAICQHTVDGGIIPLRIRVKDEDGTFHEYNIKAYKEKTHSGQFVSQYGTRVHSPVWIFYCKIQVFNSIKNIELMYNAHDNLWKIISIV